MERPRGLVCGRGRREGEKGIYQEEEDEEEETHNVPTVVT